MTKSGLKLKHKSAKYSFTKNFISNDYSTFMVTNQNTGIYDLALTFTYPVGAQ